jgi:glucokinase
MANYIAVDIGGTQIRVAVFAHEGIRPLKQSKKPTQGPDGTEIDRILSQIGDLWPEDEQVAGIGIAAPGPLNPMSGIIHRAPNIPSWVLLPLRQIVQDRFHVPVALGNDANMAALGEWRYGAGQGHNNLLYLTISTGIGGGVILDKQLVLGEHGFATELGHVTILPDGPMCSCGQRGHLEAISSGTAIANYVIEQITQGRQSILKAQPRPDGKQISDAAGQGDPVAVEAYQRAGKYLGLAIANYLHIFNPTIAILGGGVSQSGELLLAPVRAALLQYIFCQEYLSPFEITTAALGDEAGLLGAVALARTL